MNDYQLPPELESLERELAARSTPLPAAELRRRITSGVHTRLRRERRLDYWRFAAAVAIVAAVWLNLSLTAVSVTDFHFQLADRRSSVEITTREIQNLLPEMSETDVRREAMLLCAGNNLVMCPKLSLSPNTINQILNHNGLLP